MPVVSFTEVRNSEFPMVLCTYAKTNRCNKQQKSLVMLQIHCPYDLFFLFRYIERFRQNKLDCVIVRGRKGR